MENQLQNLTNEQRLFLLREIGRAKLTDIARALGWSVDDVRACAPIVLAEHSARAAKEAADAAKRV